MRNYINIAFCTWPYNTFQNNKVKSFFIPAICSEENIFVFAEERRCKIYLLLLQQQKRKNFCQDKM
jgi:hypothetical protein